MEIEWNEEDNEIESLESCSQPEKKEHESAGLLAWNVYLVSSRGFIKADSDNNIESIDSRVERYFEAIGLDR